MTDDIGKLIDQLTDFRTRPAAKARLLALGAAAVKPLIAALHHYADGVRWSAATVLGTLRDDRAVDPLIEALGDASVAGAAAEALRAITGQDFGDDAARWVAWRRGEAIEAPPPAAQVRAPLTDAELVRQGLAGIAEEVRESGAEYIAHIPLKDGRHQTVRVTPGYRDLEGNAVVLVETVCGPASGKHYEWALRQTLALPFGALAIKDIGGQPQFVMINTLLRQTCDPPEIQASVLNIARWGDAIEKALLKEDTR